MLVEAVKKAVEIIEEKYGKEHPYYTPEDLFQQSMDDGTTPLAYISTINRTAGKTTFLCILSKILFEEYGKSTVFLVRNTSEISSYHEVFGDAADLYGWEQPITSKIMVKDTLAALKYGEDVFSYVCTLKKATMLKKYSPLFRDVELVAMEEYQLEDGKYIRNEIANFRTIYRSIARGGGKQVREVPIYLIGNPVTLMNPYLIEFGITDRFSTSKRYIKNKKCVAEFRINTPSSQAILQSASSQLFSEGTNYDCGYEFLIKDDTYLEKCKGKSRYLFTIIYGKRMMGVRIYNNTGVVHVNFNYDPSCQKVLAFRENDRYQNVDILERYDYTWSFIRNAYRANRLRFGNLEAKQIIFHIIGVDLYN